MTIDTHEIGIDEFDVDADWNPRADLGDLTELVSSIKTHGILQPIVLMPTDGERHVLIAGHRRVAAARQAGVRRVPYVVLEGGDAAGATLVENLQRLDLTPLDEARAFKKLGVAQKVIAKRIGKSSSYVSNRMKLLKLPDDVAQAVGTGVVPISLADKLAAVANVSPDLATSITEAIIEDETEGQDSARVFEENPNYYISDMLGRDGVPYFVPWHSQRVFDLHEYFDADEGQSVAERYASSVAAMSKEFGSYAARWHLTQEDVDAARSFGCLLDVAPDRVARFGMAMTWATDKQWVQSHIENVVLPRCVAQWQERISAAKEIAPASRQPQAPRVTKEEKEEARRANVNFGVRIHRDLPGMLDRVAIARICAYYVLDRDGSALLKAMLQTDEQVTALKGKEQEAALAKLAAETWERIDKLDTVDDVMDVLGKLLVAAAGIDWSPALAALTGHWTIPGQWTNNDEDPARRLVYGPIRAITRPLLGDYLSAKWDREDEDTRQRLERAAERRAAHESDDDSRDDSEAPSLPPGHVETEQGEGIPAVGEPPAEPVDEVLE